MRELSLLIPIDYAATGLVETQFQGNPITKHDLDIMKTHLTGQVC